MSHPSDRMLAAYIECALWSSVHEPGDDSTGTPFDEVDAELADATRVTMARELADGLDMADESAPEWRDYWDDEQFAHDLWLTRNGHGAGFWDRYYGDQEGAHIGAALTKAAKSLGPADLHLGDDGLIYQS
jgi:hypothetical protein